MTKVAIFLIFASFLAFISCDETSSSDDGCNRYTVGEKRCNGINVEQCTSEYSHYSESLGSVYDYKWKIDQYCSKFCPDEATPSCFLKECHCSISGTAACSYSGIGEYRCNSGNLEKCSKLSSNDAIWQVYQKCSEGCPLELGATSSCSENSCKCSVPEDIGCDSSNYYRCNGSNVEKCTRLEEYNGAVWKQFKSCSNAFASNGEIVDGGACPLETEEKSYNEPSCSPKIQKAFRGKWRRLDRKEDYYLGTNGIHQDSYVVIPTKITRIDDNMIEIATENETFKLIRNSITDATLKLNVKQAAAYTRSPSGSGVGGIDVIIENTQDEGETYEKQSESDGNTEFNGIVSGEYAISVGDITVKQDIASYLNAGNFYLSKKGYIYKTIRTNQDGIYYGESRNDSTKGNKYDITLQIHNLGDTDASAATISLTTNDSAVTLTSKDEILGTIEPNRYVSYSFSIETIPFDNLSSLTDAVYHDAEFLVSIKDLKGEIWEDIVTIRIFRKAVPIYLYSTMSNTFILLSPHREIVSMSTEIWVPYRPDAKYKLIAQSLSLNTEGVYAIGVGSWDDDKWYSDKETFTDVGNYEPNDKESQAQTMYMNSQTTSYLHKNDIDFWLIDMSK